MYVCLCATVRFCVLLARLAALWVLRQAVLCTVSDVIFCLTYACQREPLVRKAHAPECVSVSFVYSHHGSSTRQHFLDWCLSLGVGGRGSSTGWELIMQRDLDLWLSRLELYSCHTGHGVHGAAEAAVWGELRHSDSGDRLRMRKRSEAVGLCVVKLEWLILDG